MRDAQHFSAAGTYRIRKAHQALALERLQQGIPQHLACSGYLQNPDEFAGTRYLARAFELLGTECELDGEDLLVVGLTERERDVTHDFWGLIEEFAEKEGAESKSAPADADEEEEEDEEDEEERYKFDRFTSGIQRERLDEDELDALVAAEGTVDFRDSDGCTPLIAACEAYQTAIENYRYVTQEASPDADEDEDDEEGGDDDDAATSAEERAAELAEAEELLAMQAFNLHAVLRRGPDIAVRSRYGSEPLGIAAASGSAEFMDLLLSHGAQVDAGTFAAAVSHLCLDVVRTLAPRHSHLASPDLVLLACNSTADKPHKLDMVKYLVDHLHGDVNARAKRALWSLQGRLRRQATPLMAAALTEDLEVLDYLLAAGADVHAVDAYGNTALHYCSGQTWLAGDTDAMWFPGEHNAQVVALLREHGADEAARNAAGRTPADLAADEAVDDGA